MGVFASLGQVAVDLIMNDGTGPGSEKAQQNMMAVGATMTGLGVGAKLMVDDVNRSFLEFDNSTTAVKALGAMSEEEFQKARDAAIDLSTQVPITATEFSDGMYKMVSVGYDFDTMMETIPEAMKLAVGGNQELAESIDTVINVMGAYGEEAYSAADITNILAKGVGVGKWELGDFTTEMMKNIGVGAQLGISFEELAAANVLLQNKFTSAEEAGTAMKTMLMRLVDPKVQGDLEDLGVHVKDADGNFVGLESVLKQIKTAMGGISGETSTLNTRLSGVGISAFDSSGKFKGMSSVLADLNEKYARTGTLTPELKTKLEDLGFKIDKKTGAITLSSKAMKEYDSILSSTGGNVDQMAQLQTLFGTEGIRAAMALIEEQDALSELTGGMNDAEQKTNAYNTVVESTGSQLEISTNKMEAAKIMMGEAMAPATVLAADAMSGLAGVILTLPQPLQEVAGLGLFAAQGFAALGPALMGLAALKGLGLGATLTSIATGLGGLGTSSVTAIAAMGPLLPILVGLAIGLAAVYALKQIGFLDWVGEQGANAGAALDEWHAGLILWRNNTLSDLEGFKNEASNKAEGLKNTLLSLPETISGAFSGLGEKVGGGLGSIPGILGEKFALISEAFTILKDKVQGTFENLWNGMTEFIGGLWKGFWSAGASIIKWLVDGMISAKETIGGAIGSIFGFLAEFVPHSPAERGPLSVLPNFGAYFVDPLLAVTPQVTEAATQVAEAATMPVSQPEALATGGGGMNIGTQDNSLSIGNVNASKDYPIEAIMADIAVMQAQKRTQRGYSSG